MLIPVMSPVAPRRQFDIGYAYGLYGSPYQVDDVPSPSLSSFTLRSTLHYFWRGKDDGATAIWVTVTLGLRPALVPL